jgi:thiamine pyrophosphokinase
VTVALVFSGGDPVDRSVTDALPADALVIAADSGIDHALAAGRSVDVAVGDFDSVSAEGLAAVRAAGATIHEHPADKDASDLELALDVAMAEGVGHVVVVGGHGGRIDHFLVNAMLLVSERHRGMQIEAWLGATRAFVLRPPDPLVLVGAPGDTVTLLAVRAAAMGVTTSGLRYPLAGEALSPGSTRGLSNELVGTEATIALTHGCLLVIQPGVDDDPVRSHQPGA